MTEHANYVRSGFASVNDELGAAYVGLPKTSYHTHLCSRDSCVGSRHATLPMRHLAPLLLGGHYYILREKCERNIRYETNY